MSKPIPGDLQNVDLREGYEQYDFEIPFIGTATATATLRESSGVLVEEMFGPVTLVVDYCDRDDPFATIRELNGQLTAAVHGEDDAVWSLGYFRCSPGTRTACLGTDGPQGSRSLRQRQTLTVMHRRVKNQRLASVGYLWAFAALTASPGAPAHYDRRKAAGDRHVAAQRNLFNRLIGILHHCLQTNTLYDENIAFPSSAAANQAVAA